MSGGLARRAVAEGTGTALLLVAVVGSGIMGERLAGGNVAVALLANALATGGALMALILTFGGLSGAHFNPVVSLTAIGRDLSAFDALVYATAQVTGAIAGVVVAHVMFGLPLVSSSSHVRAGLAQGVSEFVATFGLLLVIRGVGRHQPASAAFAVAAYIVGAYWFTASTAFANPAVTVARTMTDTFAGIRPQDAPAFVVAQLAGAVAASGLGGWLFAPAGERACPTP